MVDRLHFVVIHTILSEYVLFFGCDSSYFECYLILKSDSEILFFYSRSFSDLIINLYLFFCLFLIFHTSLCIRPIKPIKNFKGNILLWKYTDLVFTAKCTFTIKRTFTLISITGYFNSYFNFFLNESQNHVQKSQSF